jgi:hypothetical protein
MYHVAQVLYVWFKSTVYVWFKSTVYQPPHGTGSGHHESCVPVPGIITRCCSRHLGLSQRCYPTVGISLFYRTHGNCTLSLHDHGKYHNFDVPDPGNITGYLSSDPRGITKGLCPTHGISLQFSKIKWYSRGGVGQPSIWTTHNSTKEPVTALSQRSSWKSTPYSPLLVKSVKMSNILIYRLKVVILT